MARSNNILYDDLGHSKFLSIIAGLKEKIQDGFEQMGESLPDLNAITMVEFVSVRLFPNRK